MPYSTGFGGEPENAPLYAVDRSHVVVFRDRVTHQVLFTFKIVDPR